MSEKGIPAVMEYWKQFREEKKKKVIEALENTESFLNQSQMAEAIGMTAMGVKPLLDKMVEEGLIMHKAVNFPAKMNLYWLPKDKIKGIEIEELIQYRNKRGLDVRK